MKVHVKPMPESFKRFSIRFRPQPKPIFSGNPTDEDRKLAKELFDALDSESQRYYRRNLPSLFEGL